MAWVRASAIRALWQTGTRESIRVAMVTNWLFRVVRWSARRPRLSAPHMRRGLDAPAPGRKLLQGGLADRTGEQQDAALARELPARQELGQPLGPGHVV